MGFFSGLILVFLILLFLSGGLRRWLQMFIISRVQKRVMEQMRQAAEQQRQRTQQQQQSRDHQGQERPRGKMDMDAIEARRFDRGNSDDYVDFEEIPK